MAPLCSEGRNHVFPINDRLPALIEGSESSSSNKGIRRRSSSSTIDPPSPETVSQRSIPRKKTGDRRHWSSSSVVSVLLRPFKFVLNKYTSCMMAIDDRDTNLTGLGGGGHTLVAMDAFPSLRANSRRRLIGD